MTAPSNFPKINKLKSNSEDLMQKYLTALVQQIRIKVSSNNILKSEKWTKSCFNLLSDLIAHDLMDRMSEKQCRKIGTSISSKTLQKIFDGNYKPTTPIDPRALNTLNKMVFFIGYDDWNSFISKFEKGSEIKEIQTSNNEQITSVVKSAIETEFKIYLEMYKNPNDYLNKLFIEGSQSYLRIMEVLAKQVEYNCILSNKFNPSTYEILDIQVEKVSENYAQVITSEYWLLCWWNDTKKRYIKRYKSICEHFYILNKVSGNWKVKTNASTSDIIDSD